MNRKIFLCLILFLSFSISNIFSEESNQQISQKKLIIDFNTFGIRNQEQQNIISFFTAQLKELSNYQIFTLDDIDNLAKQNKLKLNLKNLGSEELQRFAQKAKIDYVLTVTISGSTQKYKLMMRFYSIEHQAFDIYNAEIYDKSELKNLLNSIAFTIATKSGGFAVTETIKLCPVPSDIAQHTNLKISTDPPGVDIYLDQTFYGKTPYLIQDLKIGPHALKLVHPYYHDSTSTIILHEEDCNNLHFAMRKRSTGTFRVNCNLLNARIYFDGVYTGDAPDTFKNIDYGKHFITVQAFLSDYNETIEIVNDDIITVNAVFNPHVDFTGTPNNANVYLDNQLRGQLPMLNQKIMPGFVKIQIKKPGYETYKSKVYIQGNEYPKYHVELKKRSLMKAITYSALLPGLGQCYSERSKRNLLYGVLGIGGLITICNLDRKMKQLNDEFDDLRKGYQNTQDYNEMLTLFDKMDVKYEKIKKTDQDRSNIIYAVLAVWTVNLIDTIILWPFGKDYYRMSMNVSSKTYASGIQISIPLN